MQALGRIPGDLTTYLLKSLLKDDVASNVGTQTLDIPVAGQPFECRQHLLKAATCRGHTQFPASIERHLYPGLPVTSHPRAHACSREIGPDLNSTLTEQPPGLSCEIG